MAYPMPTPAPPKTARAAKFIAKILAICLQRLKYFFLLSLSSSSSSSSSGFRFYIENKINAKIRNKKNHWYTCRYFPKLIILKFNKKLFRLFSFKLLFHIL